MYISKFSREIMNVIETLQERGLIEALTSEELKEQCEKPLKLYAGFDPTGESLHLGHLVSIMILHWFQKLGHNSYALIGGATAKIGDPSGKSIERPLLDHSTIENNIQQIGSFLEKILTHHSGIRPHFVNNDNWISSYPIVEFLRDVGKHFRVNIMLTKESVKSRLISEEGISFTEFSYQILQAYDFYYLYKTHDVILQVGGSDQWGNITAGTDLIRRLLGKSAYGLITPLLTRSDGKKFGKTEQGAIYLSSRHLSPYDFYQYLYRISDADVIKLLLMLTCMEIPEIERIKQSMQHSDYVPNTAQKILAQQVTQFVHGQDGLESALRATQSIAPGHRLTLNPALFQEMMKDFPPIKMSKQDILGMKFIDLALKSGLVNSKGEASRLIEQGGAYLNNERIDNVQKQIVADELVGGEFLLLGGGKKKKILIHVS